MQITKGKSKAVIAHKGAYLRSLTVNGIEILKESTDGHQTHGGAALLIPYANRVRNAEYIWNGKEYNLPKNNGGHSIHGLTKELLWSCESVSESEVTFSLNLVHDGYPVPLHVVARYRIEEERLVVEFDVENLGSIPAPIVLGMHPYFKFDRYWKLKSDRTLLRLGYEDQYFPDGKVIPQYGSEISSRIQSSYDSCFLVGDHISLETGNYNVLIQTHEMPYFVVYNGIYSEGISVAVEPMSGAPDAFNNRIGLTSIYPGNRFKCSVSFIIEDNRMENS